VAPRRPIGKREASFHAGSIVKGSPSHLERTRDCERDFTNCLVCRQLVGEALGQGVEVEEHRDAN
jgi:hypothetical protein